jgi:hypothetical protein
VSALANMARLANEAVVVAFTPVEDTSEPIMRPATPWNDPAIAYTWWALSRGLYELVFGNLGFTVEFTRAAAEWRNVGLVERPTIVARRADRPEQVRERARRHERSLSGKLRVLVRQALVPSSETSSNREEAPRAEMDASMLVAFSKGPLRLEDH